MTFNDVQTTLEVFFAALRAKPALRIVGTRGQWPIDVEGGGANTYTRFEGSYRTFIGETNVYDVRLAFTNTVALQGGESIANLADYTLNAALSGFTGGATQKLFFNGTFSPLVQVGTRLLISDPSGLFGVAGQSFQPQVGASLATGSPTSLAPVGGRSLAGSGVDRMFDSAASTSQVYTTSGLTQPCGGAMSSYGFAPVAVLGYQTRPAPALFIWGDSISWGQGDTSDGNGNVGALQRGAWSSRAGGTLPLASVNVSRSGDSLYGALATASQARWALTPYATHIVTGLGNNDIGNGQTLAQMQANAKAMWLAAKRQGLYVSQVTLTPRTRSTDSFATAANQTVAAGYEGSGYTGAGGALTRGCATPSTPG